MLSMAGIDFERFSLGQRERYAFTPSALEQAYDELWRLGAREAVLLCTCHRTELYAESDVPAADLLTGLGRNGAAPVGRQGDEAVLHIHRLSAGLCSKIVGDEQIISQISDALEASPMSGPVLRRLFSSAVSAGKRARSQTGAVRLHRGVAPAAVAALKAALGGLDGRRVLIIGSGTIACLCAKELLNSGAKALMTLRRSRKLPQALPEGVDFIEFDARYEHFCSVDAVIGATASPHYVVTRAKAQSAIGGPILMADLAVPRDIDPGCADIEGVTLLNVDALLGAALPSEALEVMERIAREDAGRFFGWRQARGALSGLEAVKRYAAMNMVGIEGLDAAQSEEVIRAAQAMVDKLLFGVKLTSGADEFSRVVGALARACGSTENEGAQEIVTSPGTPGAAQCAEPLPGAAPRFPLWLDMLGARALVVGGGNVARRRIETLLRCGMKVSVVCPEPLGLEGVEHIQRGFEPGDTLGARVVLAATNERRVNRAVALEAKANGAWVSVADAAGEGNFHFPAFFSDGTIASSVHTGEPALTKRLMERVRRALEDGQ